MIRSLPATHKRVRAALPGLPGLRRKDRCSFPFSLRSRNRERRGRYEPARSVKMTKSAMGADEPGGGIQAGNLSGHRDRVAGAAPARLSRPSPTSASGFLRASGQTRPALRKSSLNVLKLRKRSHGGGPAQPRRPNPAGCARSGRPGQRPGRRLLRGFSAQACDAAKIANARSSRTGSRAAGRAVPVRGGRARRRPRRRRSAGVQPSGFKFGPPDVA